MKKTEKCGKILIVDDDPINVDIIREILGDDYIYQVAYSGMEALETAENFHADVILLDIMMPDLDGYEVCRRFRADKSLSLTKIVLVSAKQMLDDRLEGYRAGADDYITKPFEPAELLAKIQVFIRLKSIEEIERIKSDLISVFSHETRTPLHAILGFAQLLLDNPELPDTEREALIHIKKSGEDMLDLVDKTILLSSLRDGSQEIRPKKTLLSRLVKMAIERVDSESRYRKVAVALENDSDIVVSADESLIITALACLLHNSFNYAEENSVIHVYINAESEDEGCSIAVKTTGKVISKDKLDSLFSEFAVEDVSHHGRGTGLDLSLAKNIIDLHDGLINVLPDCEAGTNLFTMTFPPEKLVLEDLSK